MAVEFDPWETERWFEPRGCRVDWTDKRYRIGGETYLGVAFTAPPWIRDELRAEVRRQGGKRVSVAGADWLDHYMFEGRVPAAVVTMLEQLAAIMSVGRKPAELDYCFALDYYKAPSDSLDPMEWPNTAAGERVHRSKYWSGLASTEAFEDLVATMADFIRSQPLLAAADCIISIPGRFGSRVGHGERLAAEVAAAVGKSFHRTKALYEQRPPAKEGGAPLREDQVEASSAVLLEDRVIIVDDVLRSGSSMKAVAASARSKGAVSVSGFAAARTLRN